MTELTAPRLRRLIERATAPARRVETSERCELCSAPIPAAHRHLLEREKRELLCACRPCSLLFDNVTAGAQRYRLVPERCVRLDPFRMDDPAWGSLRIPVEMAFFVRSEDGERVTAFYPSPAGATESLLELETWSDLERENPVLREMEPEVEALLVNRIGSTGAYWLVGLDACYRLVAVVRRHWSGLSGGTQVWAEVGRFFDELRPSRR
jgi:hypothetical protein